MQKNNKNFIRISDHDENLSNRVFMQEVINWEYIDDGIKKTTLRESFVMTIITIITYPKLFLMKNQNNKSTVFNYA